jgi:hypothetical protein
MSNRAPPPDKKPIDSRRSGSARPGNGSIG